MTLSPSRAAFKSDSAPWIRGGRRASNLGAMSEWVEVGDRCWVRRYDEWDLNIGLVAGTDGAC